MFLTNKYFWRLCFLCLIIKNALESKHNLVLGTCSKKHNIILAILCNNMIHYNLCQSVVHIDSLECWSSRNWIYRFIHHRVSLDETDDIIWKVSGWLDQWVIGFAWTLKRNEGSIVHALEKFTLTSSKVVKACHWYYNIKEIVNRTNIESHVLLNKCSLPQINPVFSLKNILHYIYLSIF